MALAAGCSRPDACGAWRMRLLLPRPLRAGVEATVDQTPTALLSFTDASLTISASAFTRLDSGRSGAVLSFSGGSVELSDSTFTACSAAGNDSAVVLVSGARLSVTNSRFVDNYSEFAGGAISAIKSSVTVSGSRWGVHPLGAGLSLYRVMHLL